MGIEKGIKQFFLDFPQVCSVSETISLCVNVDGVPLYKSSNTQL